jgi:hypothetical protein
MQEERPDPFHKDREFLRATPGPNGATCQLGAAPRGAALFLNRRCCAPESSSRKVKSARSAARVCVTSACRSRPAGRRERKAGKLLGEMAAKAERQKPGDNPQGRNSNTMLPLAPRLSDLGISKKQSDHCWSRGVTGEVIRSGLQRFCAGLQRFCAFREFVGRFGNAHQIRNVAVARVDASVMMAIV